MNLLLIFCFIIFFVLFILLPNLICGLFILCERQEINSMFFSLEIFIFLFLNYLIIHQSIMIYMILFFIFVIEVEFYYLFLHLFA